MLFGSHSSPALCSRLRRAAPTTTHRPRARLLLRQPRPSPPHRPHQPTLRPPTLRPPAPSRRPRGPTRVRANRSRRRPVTDARSINTPVGSTRSTLPARRSGSPSPSVRPTRSASPRPSRSVTRPQHGGIDLIVTNAESDLNKEISDIQGMVDQGVDALIISPLEQRGPRPRTRLRQGKGRADHDDRPAAHDQDGVRGLHRMDRLRLRRTGSPCGRCDGQGDRRRGQARHPARSTRRERHDRSQRRLPRRVSRNSTPTSRSLPNKRRTTSGRWVRRSPNS